MDLNCARALTLRSLRRSRMRDCDRMTALPQTRRRFLANTALVGAAAALAPWRALALSEQPMNAELHQAYVAGCTVLNDTYHAAIVEAKRAKFSGKATEEQLQQIIAQTKCPICGCFVVAQGASETSPTTPASPTAPSGEKQG